MPKRNSRGSEYLLMAPSLGLYRELGTAQVRSHCFLFHQHGLYNPLNSAWLSPLMGKGRTGGNRKFSYAAQTSRFGILGHGYFFLPEHLLFRKRLFCVLKHIMVMINIDCPIPLTPFLLSQAQLRLGDYPCTEFCPGHLQAVAMCTVYMQSSRKHTHIRDKESNACRGLIQEHGKGWERELRCLAITRHDCLPT